jgi:hypothetical protein
MQARHNGTGIDFESCCADLVARGGPGPRQTLEGWLANDRRTEVHKFVKGFQHKYLFEISRAEIHSAAIKTVHSLDDIKSEQNINRVKDFDTPFAFQYLFHQYLEECRSVPTWQDLRAWLKGEASARYLTPFQNEFGLDVNAQSRSLRDKRLWQALRWRLGLFYYSALREL